MRFLSPPRHILLACQPKSGSSFLTEAVGSLPGFRIGHYIAGYDRSEHELNQAHIRKYRFQGYRAIIAQHHVRFSELTKRLILKNRMLPVVLYRDLFDVIISLRDHLRNWNVVGSMAYFDQSHADLPDAELERMIARLAIPWYINFYVSWREASGVGPIMFVNYDTLRSDPQTVISDILAAAKLPASEKQITRALEQSQKGVTRFNKGVSARGKLLAPETRQIVLDGLSYYPKLRDDPFIESMFAAP